MILFSSFRESVKPVNSAWTKVSGAVYQPKGFDYPKVEWMDIRRADGTWIRPREHLDWNKPELGYFVELLAHYDARREQALAWLQEISDTDVMVCCWCPHERAAQRQIREFGSYICHLGVVYSFLKHKLKADCYLDQDRMLLMFRYD